MRSEKIPKETESSRPKDVRVVSVVIATVMFFMVLTPGLGVGSPAAQDVVYVVGAVADAAGPHLPWNNPQREQYDDVADMLYSWNLDKLLLAGDLQHENGMLEDYLKYYDSAFHKLLPISAPVPGNHDYYWDGWPDQNKWTASNGGAGFFGYFGDIANPPLGYYSFDMGSWHIIGLNSVFFERFDVNEVGSPAYDELQWLKDDLAKHPESKYPGTIAFLHHPYYSWETDYTTGYMDDALTPVWEQFYAAGVDLVVSGHSHNYQRWAPTDPSGNYDPNGVTLFVVGTGGHYTDEISAKKPPATFVYGNDRVFGALKLFLSDGSYSFEFWSISGKMLDSGYDIQCN